MNRQSALLFWFNTKQMNVFLFPFFSHWHWRPIKHYLFVWTGKYEQRSIAKYITINIWTKHKEELSHTELIDAWLCIDCAVYLCSTNFPSVNSSYFWPCTDNQLWHTIKSHILANPKTILTELFSPYHHFLHVWPKQTNRRAIFKHLVFSSKKERVCRVEGILRGHSASEPIQAKCVRQLQEQSIRTFQDC